MNYYRLTATLLAPLAIQRTRQNNAPGALPYLPGSSLRGAAAAKYLREGGSPEDDEFRTLFIENPVFFPNLLPTDHDGKIISQVLPLTSVSCKRYPGFTSENGHSVRDTLVKKMLERNDPDNYREQACIKCDNDLKGLSGFWNADIAAPRMFQPTMFFQRHTGIDRTTGTVAPKIFFITQAIADFQKTPTGDYERQILSGGMFMNDRQIAVLEPLFKTPLFAGQDRTRGMGELQVTVEPFNMEPLDIDTWDLKFKDIMEHKASGRLDPALLSGLYFSLKLESHAILVDKFLRPTTEIELTLPCVEPVLKVTKSQLIRGWNDVWGLAKPDDMGIIMGSVYLFRYTDNNREGLRQYLNKLAVDGIGLRRAEGFGSVLICDPLHTRKEAI
jgi:CRISPR-associated Csx10 family RAMP protein